MHYLGIDWATDKHDLCLLSNDGRVLSQFEITHDMAGFSKLHELLKTLPDVRINIERSDGLLVDWLVQQRYDLYITPPHVLAYRRPTRAKDDKGDAFLLAYLLRLADPDCRPYHAQSPIVMHLRQLARTYDRVLTEQRRLSNQLIMNLRQYYPVVLTLFAKVNTLISLSFLEHYPTPADAEALTYDDLEQFFRQQRYPHGRKRRDLIHDRLRVPMPRASVEAGYIEHVKLLIPLLRTLHHQKQALIKTIHRVFRSHPEADWWLAFPGTKGPLTAALMLAWIGDDRSRFPTANSLQAFAGTVPVTRRSGKSRSVQFRRACSHPMRRAADNFALQSRRHSGWARAYYNQQLTKGKSPARANRDLANRWIRIIWTLWQRREVYNEAQHVANRSRQGQAVALAKAV
jgi:transposase